VSVTIERFAPDPSHGRPRVMALSSKAGTLNVHVQVEDRSLWLFAVGPAGGNRGDLAFGTKRAGEVLAWTQAPERPLGGVRGYMVIRNGSLIVGMGGWSRQWQMKLDDAARDELLTWLSEWASRAPAGGI
jgi:hypothetical protein